MKDVTLIYSKFPKYNNYSYSFDVVLYDYAYYSGVNLYKNFENYLTKSLLLPVIKFNNQYEALKYFDNYEFKCNNLYA